jgi:hypothetical protein
MRILCGTWLLLVISAAAAAGEQSPSLPATTTCLWQAEPKDAAPPPEVPAVEEPAAPPATGLTIALDDSTYLQFNGLVRGFYRDDQRIFWSGLEQTFGAEGVLRPLFATQRGAWEFRAEGEFFLNQPYGSSILSDPVRDVYRANFTNQPFQIQQLYLAAQNGDFLVRLGRVNTPFGRYESPMFSNSLMDAPFLRTEVIGFTETGLFLRYQPQGWSADVGIINDQPDLATNSSKGLVGRLAMDRPYFTLGVSGRLADGISSDQQKRFHNLVGVDGTVRLGRFEVYSETVGDQHGFRYNFPLLGEPAGLGVRSLYGRDVYVGDNVPIYGVGSYAGIRYRGERLYLDGSFGSYFPQHIGVAFHDVPIHQGVFKASYAITSRLQVFSVGIVENYRPKENATIQRYYPYALLNGVQFGF